MLHSDIRSQASITLFCANNPMLAVTVKLLRCMGIAFSQNFVLAYMVLLPWTLINLMQFYFIFMVPTKVESLCLNAFLAACVQTALLRSVCIFFKQARFEHFLYELSIMYEELQQSQDEFVIDTLLQATRFARKVNIFLAFMAFFDTIISIIRPIFYEERNLPFNAQSPIVDMLASPAYEIMYICQLSSPYVLTGTYMPYVHIFVTSAIFMKTCLVVLQYRLNAIYSASKSKETLFEELVACIAYYRRIKNMLYYFNQLVTHEVLCEIVIYSLVICFLLYCLTAVKSLWVYSIIIVYGFTILFVLFIFYWFANELAVESLNVSTSIYDLPWYYCNQRFRSTVLLFMMHTAKPLQLMAGNMYPMNLEIFQQILNASYSYFTMLCRFTKK